jgi:uncharacterized small protein (DUF1192 family)
MGVPNGMEIMAKSFGLGPALEGVKQLVASGALEKVVQFADEIKILNERLEANEAAIAELRSTIGSLREDIARNHAELVRILTPVANATDGQSDACVAASGATD